MGGWCSKRDYCQNYLAASESRIPSERLCAPGFDGFGLSHPMVFRRAHGTWEAGSASRLVKELESLA
jgi:hypothetical protein